jgi:hypothetical protein
MLSVPAPCRGQSSRHSASTRTREAQRSRRCTRSRRPGHVRSRRGRGPPHLRACRDQPSPQSRSTKTHESRCPRPRRSSRRSGRGRSGRGAGLRLSAALTPRVVPDTHARAGCPRMMHVQTASSAATNAPGRCAGCRGLSGRCCPRSAHQGRFPRRSRSIPQKRPKAHDTLRSIRRRHRGGGTWVAVTLIRLRSR